ncbi:MAG TPA: hypothetical protein VFL94_03825 [Actinomycetales bacterium]|nr:hypothetical protein [Actinomycetales bacterium]
MSTTELSRRTRLALGIALGLVVVVTLGLVLRRWGPGNMGNGVLQGGFVTILLFAVAAWRTSRRPDRTLTAERALTGAGDERDDAVMTRSAAFVGVLALPLTGLATVALALEAPTEIVMTILLWTELILAVASFVFYSRRA